MGKHRQTCPLSVGGALRRTLIVTHKRTRDCPFFIPQDNNPYLFFLPEILEKDDKKCMNILKIAILRKFSNYLANIPHEACKKV